LTAQAALKAIKESESKYRNLFSGSKDALFIADRDLLFREVNQSASALIGLGNLELQARHLYEFIVDQNQKEKISNIIAEDKNIYDLEIEWKTLAAKKRPAFFPFMRLLRQNQISSWHHT
jgi:PAS domain S-box-containing protein